MKIFITKSKEPIFEIRDGISAGKPTKFGVFRDRFPDRDWGEIQQTNMEIGGVKEVELTEEIRQTLIGDLAYFYGTETDKFMGKLKEFELWKGR